MGAKGTRFRAIRRRRSEGRAPARSGDARPMKVNNPEVNEKGPRLRKHKSALGRSGREKS